ncbi:D-glycero-alpha-D-manno-heptose-1,7-bisphosphate 7-phosphatase [Brumimicrobium aurantiacum]|uniref:D,D-heptose 1,7-bisphosphate phosphatase n=1 Tax=Brumimicrobium aurantiacum TaxID=1737063 RepID=A0A3E1F074_9FLAO|nr:HAD family hydrolase [Brumimicrobium aurantiacum]RFC55216.1 HAD family hydrolase [Brumimicrobium aurantiacum]
MESNQNYENLFSNVDESWTLFLDRDGVINRKLDNDYVKNLDELDVFPSAIEAIALLSKYFHRIVIVTNQQGIGKGLMSHDDLKIVHDEVLDKIRSAGGKIDAVYYAPQLAAENSEMRKPEIGMAKKAQSDFPTIDFSKSIMVGDSISDMQFGDKAGMINVYIHPKSHSNYFTVESLYDLASIFKK